MELNDADFKRVCAAEYNAAMVCLQRASAAGHSDVQSACGEAYAALQSCASDLKSGVDSINVNCGALLKDYRSCSRKHKDESRCKSEASQFIECANEIVPLFK